MKLLTTGPAYEPKREEDFDHLVNSTYYKANNNGLSAIIESDGNPGEGSPGSLCLTYYERKRKKESERSKKNHAQG